MLLPKIGKNSENWLTNPSLIHIVLALAVSRPLKKSKHSCANCSFTTPISRQEWEPKEKSLKLTKPVVTYDSQYKSWNSAIFFTILNCCMHEYLSFLQKLCTENCLRFLCCDNMYECDDNNSCFKKIDEINWSQPKWKENIELNTTYYLLC